VSGQQIVGCAAVRKRGYVGYLYGLTVDKPWRRQGIGHALTRARLEWLRNEQVQSAFVMAMFWNIRFFRKHGFILTNRRTIGAVQSLHSDFSDGWSRRSALLFIDLLEKRKRTGEEALGQNGAFTSGVLD
jgi:N-acetylglutamate synthase-like GNAT family acetyltransferase